MLKIPTTIAILFVFVGSLSVTAELIAQSPSPPHSPSPLAVPPVPEFAPPPSPQSPSPQSPSPQSPSPQSPTELSPTENKIRDALQGEGTGPTGDGVLDDVLDVIKKQGSVLDGSVLDPKVNASPRIADPLSKNAIVAEQLLKSARLLEQLDVMSSGRPPSRDRIDLIRRLRGEARNLLSL